jgi:hypothetical protein
MHNLVKNQEVARIGNFLSPIIEKQKGIFISFLAMNTSKGMPVSISNIRLMLIKQ